MTGDGIAAKEQAYGIPSMQVDGNDVLAIFDAVRKAGKMAIKKHRPILIEVFIRSFRSPPMHKRCHTSIICNKIKCDMRD